MEIRRRLAGLAAAAAMLLGGSAIAEEIRIAHVSDHTGLMQAYANQSLQGFKMGLEYGTNGTMEVAGRPIRVIEMDSQLRPDLAKALLAEAYGDLDAHIAVGGTSATALAMLPVAEEFERVLIVEPAVTESITGSAWNRYIFRTSRNSSQDAISNAVAIARDDTVIATVAQDISVGREGIAAFREALDSTGAEIVHEEYLPLDTTDFSAAIERVFNSLRDLEGDKVIFIYWAGVNNPMGHIARAEPERIGARVATHGNIIPALRAYRELPGIEGSTYYYYDIPKNPINDWLVKEHFSRFGTPPDYFHAGGMAAALALIEALKRTDGSTEADALIEAMEGMEWQTPKGTMRFRAEDHQALQEMYHFRIRVDEDVDWGIPELVKVLGIDDMDVPIRNQR